LFRISSPLSIENSMVKTKSLFMLFVFLATFGQVNQVSFKNSSNPNSQLVTLEGDAANAGPIWDWIAQQVFNKVKSKVLGVPGWVAYTWLSSCIDGVNACQVSTVIYVENWKFEQALGYCSSDGRGYLPIIKGYLRSQGINNQVYYLGSTGNGFRYGIGRH
jgi:hypothetical protein